MADPAVIDSSDAPPDPVRAVTAAEVNQRIDRDIDAHIAWYRTRPRAELDGRVAELEREWDIERWLETNASILALSGLALGILKHRAWLALPVVVSGFLLQHAVRGWCPPIWLFRRLGARTRQEIDRELYALKTLRGDLAHLQPSAVSGGSRPTLDGMPMGQAR
jgi:hypothetical protein